MWKVIMCYSSYIIYFQRSLFKKGAAAIFTNPLLGYERIKKKEYVNILQIIYNIHTMYKEGGLWQEIFKMSI